MIGSCYSHAVLLARSFRFLSLISWKLQQRTGQVIVRVGGNTQDTVVLVPSTPNGLVIEKDLAGVTSPLAVCYPNKRNLIRYLRLIPLVFHPRSHIHARRQTSSLSQLSDLYASHGHRPANYSPYGYFCEFGVLVTVLNIRNRDLLL